VSYIREVIYMLKAARRFLLDMIDYINEGDNEETEV
jgi:hypothetical protein